jgi:RNase P/RNase MRP subunit p29
MEGGFAMWMGLPVVLSVSTGNLLVPLRGRLIAETKDVVRVRIADSWDVDIYKAMVMSVEHDKSVHVVN